ncbi:MAG: hypothetical protein RLZZ127_1128 [Planctomycetota bacterium]|jgi:TPR repeat protein
MSRLRLIAMLLPAVLAAAEADRAPEVEPGMEDAGEGQAMPPPQQPGFVATAAPGLFPGPGGTVAAVALDGPRLWAAGSAGLAVSGDGRTWRAVPGFPAALTGVAAADGWLVAATDRELLWARIEDDGIPSVSGRRAVAGAVTALLPAGGGFVAVVGGRRLLRGHPLSGWKPQALPGIDRIVSVVPGHVAYATVVAENAVGVVIADLSDEPQWDWTPYPAGAIDAAWRIDDRLLLRERASGRVVDVRTWQALVLTPPSAVVAAAAGDQGIGLRLATADGRILSGGIGDPMTALIPAGGPAAAALVESDTTLVAIGAGVRLLDPAAEGAPSGSWQPWDGLAALALPVAATFAVHPESFGTVTLVRPGAPPLAVIRDGRFRPWHPGAGWGRAQGDQAYDGACIDVAARDGIAALLTGERLDIRTAAGRTRIRGPGLARIATGPGGWIGLDPAGAVRLGPAPDRLVPTPAAGDGWTDMAPWGDAWLLAGRGATRLARLTRDGALTGIPTREGLGDLHAVAVAGDRALAVGDRGQVWIHADGVWRLRLIAGAPDLRQAALAPGVAAVATASGGILVSADGAAWHALPARPCAWRHLAASGDAVLAVAPHATLVITAVTATGSAIPAPERTWAQVQAEQAAAFAPALAAWDEGMTTASGTEARLALCAELHQQWRSSHPDAEPVAQRAYLDGLIERLIGYRTEDEVIYQFAMGLPFSREVLEGWSQGLSENLRECVQRRASWVVEEYAHRYQGGPAPKPWKPYLQVAERPPGPIMRPAALDPAAVRLAAASGSTAAMLDLTDMYLAGTGVPTDLVAARYWWRRARISDASDDLVEQDRRFAELGSAMRMEAWAGRLTEGDGVAKDLHAARAWRERAVAAGNRRAAAGLAGMLRKGLGGPADPVRAFALVDGLAATGHPDVLADRAWCHETGAGTPRRTDLARADYGRAAAAGHAWAADRLGELLLTEGAEPAAAAAAFDRAGPGAATRAALAREGRLRPRRAAVWYGPEPAWPEIDIATTLQRAQAGDAAACWDLHRTWRDGMGVEPDPGEAARWRERAIAAGLRLPEGSGTAALAALADQGSAVAAADLARWLGTRELWLRAASAGSLAAMTWIGDRIRDGGTDLPGRALDWFLRAAEGGSPDAQNVAGWASYLGRLGVDRDRDQAVRWWRRAAATGHRAAMANLVLALAERPADHPAAAAWYLRLAGLPASATAPEAAAELIRAAAASGEPRACAAWSLMLQRGFGFWRTIPDATKLALVADQGGVWPRGLGMVLVGGEALGEEILGAADLAAIHRRNLILDRLREDPAAGAAAIAADAAAVAAESAADGPAAAWIRAVLLGPDPDQALGRSASVASRLVPRALPPVRLAGIAPGAPRLRALAGLNPEGTAAPRSASFAHAAWESRKGGSIRRRYDDLHGIREADSDAAAAIRVKAIRRLCLLEALHGVLAPADPGEALAWALVDYRDPGALGVVERVAAGVGPAAQAAAVERFRALAEVAERSE